MLAQHFVPLLQHVADRRGALRDAGVSEAHASKSVAALLWLESTPQHFNGADGTGLFSDKKKPVSCAAIRNFTAAAWRNDHFDQWSRARQPELNSEGWRIVRQFDALLPLQLMHPVNDCTHFCYSPFLYGPAWDGIGSVLSG